MGKGWLTFGATQNPADLRGRHVPEKYLAGLSPALRRQRLAELTASREGRLGYEPLPTDIAAQRKGLVKRSSYIVEAEKRGIEHRGDYADTAARALRYYGVEPTSRNVGTVARELEKVFKKGLAAWQTGGHRPGASQGGWAYARVASVLTGGKAAFTADSGNVDRFPAKMKRGIREQRVWAESNPGEIPVRIGYAEWRMFTAQAPHFEDYESYRVMARRGDSFDWVIVPASRKELRHLVKLAQVLASGGGYNTTGWEPRAAHDFLSRFDDLTLLSLAMDNPEDNPASTYAWMPLEAVLPFVPAMRAEAVSEVARSPRGFLTAYKRSGGDRNRMGTDSYSGQDWRTKRDGFVARHWAQIKKRGEPLWSYGEPTRRHLALIAWAFTPDPQGVKRWLQRRG